MAVPAWERSRGVEALELAESVGLVADEWQRTVIMNGCALRGDGRWAAFEVAGNVPRQNGKGGLLEVRELAGLFLWEDRLLIHSAHQFDTSLEAFRRLLFYVESSDELRVRVKRVSRSHGEEGIELLDGSRIRFRTRTKGGGRGFSCDCLMLDEAMVLPEASHGALLPTLSARANPQVWYMGSAVDQLVHDEGVVFARVRERGLRGDDPRLAYFEWSASGDWKTPDEVEETEAADPQLVAQANPGLGIRILLEHVESERRAMDARTFAVERLGIGDWPDTDRRTPSVIDLEQWKALEDRESRMLDPICIAFDVSPARSSAAIVAAGLREDGRGHVEVIERRPGTGWVVERLAELEREHEPAVIVCDAASPAGSLLDELEAKHVDVETTSATDFARACAVFFDAVADGKLRHLGTSELRAAIKGAKKRKLGEAWAWSRGGSTVDITPLVAGSLAVWAAMREQPSVYEDREAVAV